jgi:hypothetical protein
MEVLAAPLEQSEIDELVPQLLEGLDGIMRRQCDKETLSTSYRRDSFTLFLCRFEHVWPKTCESKKQQWAVRKVPV